jgi:integrase
MTVANVVDEFIKEKKLARKSDRYLYDLNYRLGKIKSAFVSEIATVDRTQIQGFLNALNLGARSHNNFRDALITLFRFAKKRNYLPTDWNELATVEAITDKGGAIEFYTPAELAAILTGAGENLIPFLTVGAFAGLRSAEICRLDWSSVNFDTGFITVEAGNAKTAARRTVPITENLEAWLKTRARKNGPVLKQSETVLYAELRALIKETNTKWKDNGLRHSFITYRVAESQDVNKTALEAGNSPAMIFRNYRALVTPKDAARWFSIKPDDSAEGKITRLKVA